MATEFKPMGQFNAMGDTELSEFGEATNFTAMGGAVFTPPVEEDVAPQPLETPEAIKPRLKVPNAPFTEPEARREANVRPGWIPDWDLIKQYYSEGGKNDTAQMNAVADLAFSGNHDAIIGHIENMDQAELDVASNRFTQTFYNAARMLPYMWEGGKWQLAGAGIGALGGGALGLLGGGPVGLGAGAIAGAKLGTAAGSVASAAVMYRLGVGEFMMNMTSEGVAPEDASIFAKVGAIPYAAIEMMQLDALNPAVRGLVNRVTHKATKETLQSFGPTFIKNALKTGVAESGEEGLQEMVKTIYTNIAKALGDLEGFDSSTLMKTFEAGVSEFMGSLGEAVRNGANEAVRTLPEMILIGGPSSAVSSAVEVRDNNNRVRAAEAAKAATTPSESGPTLSEESTNFITARNTEEKIAARTAAVSADLLRSERGDKNLQFLRDREGKAVVVEIEEANVDQTVKDQAYAIQAMMEEFNGKPVVFIDGETPAGANAPNAIYLNINTPGESLHKTALHESGHSIHSWAMKTGNEQHLQTINELVGEFQKNTAAWKKFSDVMKSQGVTVAELTQETVAMAFSHILSDQDTMESIMESNPTLFAKMIQMVKDFFAGVGKVAGEALGLKKPMDFFNPTQAAETGQGLNSFTEESLQGVFGDGYEAMRTKMVAAAKAYVKRNPEAAEAIDPLLTDLEPPKQVQKDLKEKIGDKPKPESGRDIKVEPKKDETKLSRAGRIEVMKTGVEPSAEDQAAAQALADAGNIRVTNQFDPLARDLYEGRTGAEAHPALRASGLNSVVRGEDGKPVAAMWSALGGNQFQVDIAVDKDHRRQGHARSLLRKAKEQFESTVKGANAATEFWALVAGGESQKVIEALLASEGFRKQGSFRGEPTYRYEGEQSSVAPSAESIGLKIKEPAKTKPKPPPLVLATPTRLSRRTIATEEMPGASERTIRAVQRMQGKPSEIEIEMIRGFLQEDGSAADSRTALENTAKRYGDEVQATIDAADGTLLSRKFKTVKELLDADILEQTSSKDESAGYIVRRNPKVSPNSTSKKIWQVVDPNTGQVNFIGSETEAKKWAEVNELVARVTEVDKFRTFAPQAVGIEVFTKGGLSKEPRFGKLLGGFWNDAGDMLARVEFHDKAGRPAWMPVDRLMLERGADLDQTFLSRAWKGMGDKLEPESGYPHGRFKLEYAGTGQGQAQGYGLYFADVEETADSYRAHYEARRKMFHTLPIEGGKFALFADGKQLRPEFGGGTFDTEAEAEAAIAAKPAASIYGIDIPDSIIAKMLDWDNAVPQAQLDAIRKVMRKQEGRSSDWVTEGVVHGAALYDNLIEWFTGGERVNGEERHNGKVSASGVLARAGIPGNKYLDQLSRNVNPFQWRVTGTDPSITDDFIQSIADDEHKAGLRGNNDASADFKRRRDEGDHPHIFETEEEAREFMASDYWKKLSAGLSDVKIEKYAEAEKRTYNYVVYDQEALDQISVLERNNEIMDAAQFDAAFSTTLSRAPAATPEQGAAARAKVLPILKRFAGDTTKLEVMADASPDGDKFWVQAKRIFVDDKEPIEGMVTRLDALGKRGIIPKTWRKFLREDRELLTARRQKAKAIRDKAKNLKKKSVAEQKAQEKIDAVEAAGFKVGDIVMLKSKTGSRHLDMTIKITGANARYFFAIDATGAERKFERSSFSESNAFAGGVYLNSIIGEGQKRQLQQVPVSEIVQTKNKTVFVPTRTVGEFKAGQIYERDTMNFFVTETEAEGYNPSSSDRSWFMGRRTAKGNVIGGFVNEELIEHMGKKWYPRLRSVSVDWAQIASNLTKKMELVAATDPALVEGIPADVKNARLDEIGEQFDAWLKRVTKTEQYTVHDLLAPDETLQDLLGNERSTAFRVAVLKRMGGAIHEEMRNYNKKGDFIIDPTIVGDTLAAKSDEITEAEKAYQELSEEGTLDARTGLADAVKFNKDENQILNVMARAVAKEGGSLQAILADPKAFSEVAAVMFPEAKAETAAINRKIQQFLNPANANAEGAGTLLSRSTTFDKNKEADKAARKYGFKDAADVGKASDSRVLQNAKSLASKPMNTYSQILQAMTAAGVITDRINRKTLVSEESAAVLRELNKRYTEAKRQASIITGERTTGERERFRSLVEQDNIIDGLSRANRIKGKPTPAQAELAKIRASSTEAGVAKSMRKAFETLHGSSDKVKDDANKAIESIWQELGKPTDRVKLVDSKFNLTGDEGQIWASEDPVYMSEIRRAVESRMASTSDKALEWWKSAGLLSGIPTILQNPASNAIRQLYEYGPKKLITNIIQGKGVAGSVGAMLYTMKLQRGFARRAREVARLAWHTEEPVIKLFGYGYRDDVTNIHHAFKGGAGRTIRLPYRFLTIGDEYFKMMDIQTNIANQYYLSAIAGIDATTGNVVGKFTPTEKQVADFVTDVLENPEGNAVNIRIIQTALENTWQNKNNIAAPFAAARSNTPGHIGEYIIPFVNTPMNILTQSLRQSPLGIVNMGFRTIQAAVKRSKNPDAQLYFLNRRNDEFARDASEQVIAWGLVAALSPFVLKDDDDDDEWVPRITGGEPFYKSEGGKSSFQRKESMPAMHIRIGKRMFDYSRIEPLATVLPVIIDGMKGMQNVKKGDDPGRAAAIAFSSMGVAITDKTFLGGLQDIVKVLESPDQAGRWVSNFAASWVPNIARSAMRVTDPYARDLTPKGERYSKDWVASLGKKTLYRMIPSPGVASVFSDELTPPPQYDYWGQPISKTNADSAQSDMVYRILQGAGLKIKLTKDNELNRMRQNWNERERFKGLEKNRDGDLVTYGPKYLFKPGRYFEIGRPNKLGAKQKYYMTDDEYQEYIRMSGQIALDRASKVSFNYDHPTARDMKRLGSIMEMSRRIARNRLKRKVLKR